MTLTEPLCLNRRCIVVGSAPGLKLPDREPGDVVLGANGGAYWAKKAGHNPDILLTTSYLFRSRSSYAEKVTREQLENLTVSKVWLDTKCPPKKMAVEQISDLGIRWNHLQFVNEADRDEIVVKACTESLRVSTGVFGVCLSLISGASKIVVCGIEPQKLGHEGIEGKTRDHQLADSACLALMMQEFRRRIEWIKVC